jgi:hypothetical protein
MYLHHNILKFLIDFYTYVDGNCCSNLDLIDDAISCSVVKLAMASCAAVIANSCIAGLIKEVFTTDLALILIQLWFTSMNLSDKVINQRDVDV